MARSVDETNRIGVHAVGAILSKMGWAFREQATSDFGIDAQAEKLNPDGSGTGKLIALQIKTGASWFRARGDDYVYYGEPRHREYWTNHALPVFVVLHNPENGLTLWQRVERHLIEDGKGGRWAIGIPATNTLDAAHEGYILAGIASDPTSVRRYRLALDLPLLRRVAAEDSVYLRVEDWVNKSLNFRNTEVVFDEDPEGDAELRLDTWLPARGIAPFMARIFPWLDYEHLEYDESGGAGELAIHTLKVELSEIGRAALLLESFYDEGAPEREDLPAYFPSTDWIESIDDVGNLD